MLELIMRRSEELHFAIIELLDDAPVYPGERNEVAMVACGVAFEHAEGLRILFDATCSTSAVSMLRLQFEALTRAMWLLCAASDLAVEKLTAPLTPESEKMANKLPMVGDMVDMIVKKAPPAASQMLVQFKDMSWSAMNSYVHSGIHPLRRHAEGYRYTSGDMASVMGHRREHARIRNCLDPVPIRAFSERLMNTQTPELVDTRSPKWMHREMYERAVHFKRELGFDFTMWEGQRDKKNLSLRSHGYLFSDHTGHQPLGTIIGACSFWKDDSRWRLRWIWICPKMRRTGALAHRWQQFLECYGDFEIDVPLSEGMRGFVLKKWQSGTTDRGCVGC